MMKEFTRSDRVSQQIKKEVALIIQREIKHPRLAMVTVSDVEISRDLAYGKVFVTMFEQDDEKVKLWLKIPNDAAGYIRSLLGKRIRARIMPALTFVLDTSLLEGLHIASVVEQAVRQDKARRAESGANYVDEAQSEQNEENAANDDADQERESKQ